MVVVLNRSSELVPRLQLATIELGLIRTNLQVAFGPRQPEGWSQRKYNLRAVQVSFQAGPFRGGWQRETHGAPIDGRVCLANGVARQAAGYLGFHQERRRVGPIAHRDSES